MTENKSERTCPEWVYEDNVLPKHWASNLDRIRPTYEAVLRFFEGRLGKRSKLFVSKGTLHDYVVGLWIKHNEEEKDWREIFQSKNSEDYSRNWDMLEQRLKDPNQNPPKSLENIFLMRIFEQLDEPFIKVTLDFYNYLTRHYLDSATPLGEVRIFTGIPRDIFTRQIEDNFYRQAIKFAFNKFNGREFYRNGRYKIASFSDIKKPADISFNSINEKKDYLCFLDFIGAGHEYEYFVKFFDYVSSATNFILGHPEAIEDMAGNMKRINGALDALKIANSIA